MPRTTSCNPAQFCLLELKFRKSMSASVLLRSADASGQKKHFLFLRHDVLKSIDKGVFAAINGYCSQLRGTFTSALACWCVFLAQKKEFSSAIASVGFSSGTKALVLCSLKPGRAKKLLSSKISPGIVVSLVKPASKVSTSRLSSLSLFFADNFL